MERAVRRQGRSQGPLGSRLRLEIPGPNGLPFESSVWALTVSKGGREASHLQNRLRAWLVGALVGFLIPATCCAVRCLDAADVATPPQVSRVLQYFTEPAS